MTQLEDTLNKFLNPENTIQTITIERVVVALLVTFVVSMLVFLVYKKTFQGVLYTRNFNLGLVMTSLVTTMIIIPISSNILLSLGMIGALSIVRFRTAIKDPMDIVFTFWAIAIGVSCGAGMYMVAFVGTLMIGFFVFLLSNLNLFQGSDPYLLVVHYPGELESKVKAALPTHRLRSRTVTPEEVELMAEIRLEDEQTSGVVDELMRISGVRNAALVSYNGDLVS